MFKLGEITTLISRKPTSVYLYAMMDLFCPRNFTNVIAPLYVGGITLIWTVADGERTN